MLCTGEHGYQFEQTAKAISMLVEELGLEGCSLVGYSMGARLALHLACFHPDLFKTVISISGSPGLARRTSGFALYTMSTNAVTLV